MKTKVLVVLAAVLVWGAACLEAAEPARKKVLILGIDGCRADVFPACLLAKHLPKLIAEGAFSDQVDVLGDRDTGAYTVTGPGWSNILTGVLADKHGCRSNDFKGIHYDQYPTFFKHLKEVRPSAMPVALVSWLPFTDHIFSADEGARLVVDGDKVGYQNADKAVAEAAVKVLTDEDPDVLFAYFGDVDINGHTYHFHPKSPKYTSAVERIDEHIGNILAALHARPNLKDENWLIMVGTDHGGIQKDHMDGKNIPEVRNGFAILDGPSVIPGKIEGRRSNADFAVTALTHLGVPIDPAWQLDGHSFPLKQQ